MQGKLDWSNRFNALDSLNITLYRAIEEMSLRAKEEWPCSHVAQTPIAELISIMGMGGSSVFAEVPRLSR